MSETEHRAGKLIPTGKTLQQFAPLAEDEQDLDEAAVIIDGLVYTVEETGVDQYADIFNSSKNKDGSISFEVKYYNGGCGFYEAIEKALSNGSTTKV